LEHRRGLSDTGFRKLPINSNDSHSFDPFFICISDIFVELVNVLLARGHALSVLQNKLLISPWDCFVSDFYRILNLLSTCACKNEQLVIEMDTIVLSYFSDEQKGMLGPAFLRS
jgi:hypothetical protein